MFRLDQVEGRSNTLITVDGNLSADQIEVLEGCCEHASAQGKPVHLYLRDVSSVDQAGCDLLCRLAAKGVRLLASGVYTSYLVRCLMEKGASADRTDLRR